MSQDNLEHLRQELEILSLRMMELVDQRFEIIQDIQKIKQQKSQDLWSPEREYKMFKKYIELTPKADLRFDQMYSLLIEVQASRVGNYPEWSKGVHLEQGEFGLEAFINPILLYMRDKKAWNKLTIKADYLTQIEEVLK